MMMRYLATAVALVMFAALAASGAAPLQAQSTGTLTVKPSKTQVGVGETFTVDLVQNADYPTLGAQGSVSFDPAVLQITAVEPGPAYADALFTVGVQPETVDDAIASANSTGLLVTLGTFYFPGTTAVPAGATTWVRLTMRGQGQGSSQISILERPFTFIDPVDHVTVHNKIDVVGFLPDPPNLDASLAPANVAPSQVTVSGSAAPGATTPAASASGSATPKPSRTVASASTTPRGSGGSGPSIIIDPAESTVALGETFSIEIKTDSDVEITGAALDLTFDKGAVTVESVEAGEEWTASATNTYSDQVTQANSSGELSSLVLTRRTSDDPIPAGEVTLFTITFKAADKDAGSDLTVENAILIDAEGDGVPIAEPTVGKAIVGAGGSDGGGGGMGIVLILLGGIVVIGAVGGGGAYAYRNMRQKRWGE